MALSVVETFSSIQGESSFAGQLCFFIRLAGCNLNCSYCDTRYARKVSDGVPVEVEQLLCQARESGLELVEITGGEPLIHEETADLCDVLMRNGFKVLLETNGSLPIDVLPPGVVRIIDCKTPSSGEFGNMLIANFGLVSSNDEIKFVLATSEDVDFAERIICEYDLLKRTAKVLFSPVTGRMDLKVLAERIIRSKLLVRIQPQLHKMIWDESQRGV